MKAIFVLLLAMGLLFSIQMVSPAVTEISSGETIDVGTMGPGQTMEILIYPKVYSGGINGIGGTYDQAYAYNLPNGWSSTKSKLYGNPLQVTITSDPYAQEGTYAIPITVEDEGNGEKLGNVSFYVRVQVSEDVMNVNVYPTQRKVGIGQPASFEITVENKGSAGDTFRISATGVSKWDFTKLVYVPPKGTKKILYEVAGLEEEDYSSMIKVESSASPRVSASAPVSIHVYPDLLSDYKAVNNGALLFPVIEAPVYSFIGLLSNFW